MYSEIDIYTCVFLSIYIIIKYHKNSINRKKKYFRKAGETDMATTYVYRTEQTIIRKSNPLYKKLDDLAFKAKNIYNLCLYEQRQIYFQYKKFINYNDLYHIVKDTEGYKDLPTVLGQQVIMKVNDTCKSFICSTKSYYNNPGAFTS